MTNKIELVDVIPTAQEIVNYGKYISTLNLGGDNEDDYEKPYTITDEELTQRSWMNIISIVKRMILMVITY